MKKNLFYFNYRSNLSIVTLSLLLLFVFSSCGDIKQLQYLQGSFDSTNVTNIKFVEPVIQKGDILNITVYSENELASSLYNQKQTAKAASGVGVPSGAAGGEGYLVDQEGSIMINQLGKFHAEGMTKKQLSESIAKQYLEKDLLKSPYVDVRFVNFKVTLIGDVMHPGVYSIPTDKVSILEAIGLAGDLTNYARRDNVLVIRETNGVREFGRLDLGKTDVFNSPYFYLRQNDIIVIDVAKSKAGQTNETTVRYITVAASVLATVAIFISVFKK